MANKPFTSEDERRLRELSGRPRTLSEDREYGRLQTKRSRYRKSQIQAASKAGDREQFWQENRAALTQAETMAMQAQHETCLDKLYWFDCLDDPAYTSSDPDYVSLQEGTQDLVEFVREHGVTHLGYITRDLDIPPDWCSRPYWRNPDLLAKLCAENWQTERYVRFGYLAALPDWKVADFLTTKAGWSWEQAAELVGYRVSRGAFLVSDFRRASICGVTPQRKTV